MTKIHDEYITLLKDRKNYRIYVSIVAILLMAGFVAFVTLPNISKLTGIEIVYVVLIPVILLIGSFFTAWYSNRYYINKDRKLLLNYYGIYNFISEFIQKKSDTTKIDAQDKIYDTMLSVNRWTKPGVPSVLTELPKSLSKNLDKLWELIEEIETDEKKITQKKTNDAKYDELQEFNNKLYEFALKIFEKRLTYEDLQNFNKSFDSISSPKQKPSTKEQIKIISQKLIITFEIHPKLKFIFAPIAGTVVGLVIFANDPTDTSLPLSTGIVSGIMLLIGLPQIWKNKQS